MNLTKGHYTALASGIVWGTVGIFVRELYDAGLTPLQLSMFRTSAMAAITALIMLLYDRKLFLVRRKHLRYIVPMGLFGTALGYITYSNAMKYTTLAIASMLTYTNPIYTTFLAAVFLKEKVYKGKIAGLILLVTGCALLVKIYDSTFFRINTTGIINGLLTGVFVSISALCAKRVTRDYHPITTVFYNFFVGTLFLIIFSFPWETDIVAFGPKEIIYFIYLILFPGVLGFSLYMYSVKRIEISQTESCVTVEPVIAGIIGFLFFDEAFSPIQFIGAAVILIGVLVFNDAWGFEKRSEKNKRK